MAADPNIPLSLEGLLPFLEMNSKALGALSEDDFRRYGALLTPQVMSSFLLKMSDHAYRSVAMGGRDNLLQNFLSRIDRFGTAAIPQNNLNSGYTFITRPRLNLSSLSLRTNNVLRTLDTTNKNSVSFMIRALLDTKLCNSSEDVSDPTGQLGANSDNAFSEKAATSGLVDVMNPFLTPLMNGLKDISGYPDFTLEVETTDGGFHSEDYTFIRGSDMNNRSVQLQLNFRDVQGGILMTILYIWALYMALQAKGEIMAYQDDIYEQRLNYTVSIYRFVMDTSKKYIVDWSKATGCMPIAVPIGAIFNINQGEVGISSARNFSIPFMANKIEVREYGILKDFNRLMMRYCPLINDKNYFTPLPMESGRNFEGLPFVVSEEGGNGLELQFRTNPIYNRSMGVTSLATMLSELEAERQMESERLLAEAMGSLPATSIDGDF